MDRHLGLVHRRAGNISSSFPIDVVHELRRVVDQLSCPLILQPNGKEGPQMHHLFVLLEQAQGFPHHLAALL